MNRSFRFRIWAAASGSMTPAILGVAGWKFLPAGSLTGLGAGCLFSAIVFGCFLESVRFALASPNPRGTPVAMTVTLLGALAGLALPALVAGTAIVRHWVDAGWFCAGAAAGTTISLAVLGIACVRYPVVQSA